MFLAATMHSTAHHGHPAREPVKVATGSQCMPMPTEETGSLVEHFSRTLLLSSSTISYLIVFDWLGFYLRAYLERVQRCVVRSTPLLR